MLAATTVVVAGYAWWNSKHRAPVPTRASVGALVKVEEPATVVGLPPIPPYRRGIDATTRAPSARPMAAVEVVLESELQPAAQLGIGILDGDSAAVLAWRDLGFPVAADSLRFEQIPEGRHWVVLARDSDAARYSYTARAVVEVGADGGVATLRPDLHDVVFEFSWPGLAHPMPPIVRGVLQRKGDPSWSYRARTRKSLVYDESIRLVLRDLGPGDYVLEVEGAEVDPEDVPRLSFTVPGTDAVRLRLRPGS